MSPTGSPGTWRATWWVARKELVTSFRDRQTAIYAVVLPICLYPVLFWLMIQGALLIQGRREHTAVEVGVAAAAGVEAPARLSRALSYAAGSSEEPSSAVTAEEGADPEDFDPEHAAQAEAIERVELRDLANAPDAERAYADSQQDPEAAPDAVLYLGAEGEHPLVIAYDSTDSRSTLAEARLRERLEDFVTAEREAAAGAAGVDPRDLEPLSTDSRNLAPDEEMGAYVLSLLFPLLLVLMTVMGAFHPAVDLTAGERERGTLETTLILPVPRQAVHQGKILAVCASAVLATSLNLLALGLSAGHLLKMIDTGAAIQIELPVAAFAQIAPLALLFTFFVSALLTGIAALAKSFKEGQALLGPVQLLFIVPAMAGMLPGLELDLGTALIPIVNVVMAFRSMLRGDELPLEYALTAASLLVYAALAIAFAVRVLSRESLGVAGETIPLQRLFSYLRSERGTR